MADSSYIVVFDDEQGVCCPMGPDDDCEGALCTFHKSQAAALFGSRAEARKAIRVSTAFAKLRRAQGKHANEDFLDAIACVKIIECVGAAREQGNG